MKKTYRKAKYTSPLGTHSINFAIDDDLHSAYVDSVNIGNGNPVELTIFIKNVSQDLEKSNIKSIVQPVTRQDWDTILCNINEFKMHRIAKEHIQVICEVSEFPAGFMKGLGFEEF